MYQETKCHKFANKFMSTICHKPIIQSDIIIQFYRVPQICTFRTWKMGQTLRQRWQGGKPQRNRATASWLSQVIIRTKIELTIDLLLTFPEHNRWPTVRHVVQGDYFCSERCLTMETVQPKVPYRFDLFKLAACVFTFGLESRLHSCYAIFITNSAITMDA